MNDPRAALIDEAFENRAALAGDAHKEAVYSVINTNGSPALSSTEQRRV